jgi:hypothetical protein
MYFDMKNYLKNTRNHAVSVKDSKLINHLTSEIALIERESHKLAIIRRG